MKTFKCPSCDADLSFSDDREFGFCEYCGTKILLGDYSVNHIKKYIVDEAALKNAEIREKELKFKERKYKVEQRQRKMDVFLKLFPFVGTALLFIIGYVLFTKENDLGLLLILLGFIAIIFKFSD